MHRRDHRTFVDGVDFGSIFQVQTIFRAIASSMEPSRLIIGLGMVLVLMSTGRLWDMQSGVDAITLDQSIDIEALEQERELAIAQSVTALGHTAPEGFVEWNVPQAQDHLLEAWKDYVYEGVLTVADREEFNRMYLALEEVRPKGPFEASAHYVATAWNGIVDAGLELDPVGMWLGTVAIVWELPQLLWKGGYHWFISIYGFVLIFVLCVGGGAIARMQACWHARSHRLSMNDAIDYSLSRWRALILAIFGPAMFVAAITIVLMVMGLILLNIPWLNLIGGLLYGVSLLLGFLVAMIAVGYAACFPMLIPAVIVENCGGGEAVQRSYSYVLTKSFRFAGYLFVLVVSLVLGFLVVRLVTNVTLDLTANLVGAWTFNNSLHNAGALRDTVVPLVSITWYESSAGWLINMWETILHYLMIGWVFSGFFSTSTMLYLLMRKVCDEQDTRDIWWKGLIQGTNVPE
jgi:hypothetical protein